MNDLLMLIAIIIESVGAAALVLALSKVVIITLPEILIRTVRSNGAPLVSARQRSTEQKNSGSCSFCQSGTYLTGSNASVGNASRSSSDKAGNLGGL